MDKVCQLKAAKHAHLTLGASSGIACYHSSGCNHEPNILAPEAVLFKTWEDPFRAPPMFPRLPGRAAYDGDAPPAIAEKNTPEIYTRTNT